MSVSLSPVWSLQCDCVLQDLPEYFEDNMTAWMDHFHTLLTTDNKLLETDVSAQTYTNTHILLGLMCAF